MNYSHSLLETYETCPLKYRLIYADRVKTERKSVEAFMGSLVHETMEWLYRQVIMARVPSLEEVESFFSRRWDRFFHDGIFVANREFTAGDYREAGLKCLRSYYRRYFPFDSGKPVWLEKKVVVPIPLAGQQARFVGVVDRLDSLGGGRYEIHDYKTGAHFPTLEELERDRQLTLYQMAVESSLPGVKEVELVWHYMLFDEELRLRRSAEDVRRVAQEASELVREIESRKEFPPREGDYCDWCEVQEFCPKRKHLHLLSAEAAPELGYDRGAELVDEFARWKEAKDEAERQLKRLREEIMEFSAFHQVDNIYGTGHLLKISRCERWKLPSAGSEERERLADCLREMGFWEKASDVSEAKLQGLLRELEDREEGDRLKSYLTREESVTLRLSRKVEADD
ncbi:MAG: PD-(D/E)XK nuclease family protein [Candidatus Geothermincolales bacterium]